MLDISRIDLQNLDQKDLQRVKLMLDINKIQQDIAHSMQAVEESRASVRRMEQSIEESRANTEKIQKEARFYPYVTLGSAMVGGLIVFVLTRFFA